jgi:photosystem II stability/assembly factor-like uncharacterized protein
MKYCYLPGSIVPVYFLVLDNQKNLMKKSLTPILIAACFIVNTSKAQQKHDWKMLYTGYMFSGGVSKLIVKKNCVYIFNSTFSTLLRSADRGLSWDSLYIASDEHEHEYTGITFINDSVGYLAGYDGDHHAELKSVIKKTTDRGLTWHTIAPKMVNPTAFIHINFFSTDTGMVFGTGTSKTERYITVDGGLNWTYLPDNGPAAPLITHSWFKGKEGMVIGFTNSLNIDVTHDNGNTWSSKKFPGILPSNGFKFFDSQHGVVVAEDSIYITSDGIASFSSKAKFPYSNVIRSFDMLDMQRGFYCTGQSIYYTPDAGNTWILSYTDPSINITDLRIEGNEVFVSTLQNNIILKLDISDLISGLHEIKFKQDLLSIYPNPATDKIHITNLGNEKLLTVTITDQLGRVIKQQSLHESKIIDVKDLNRGIYIVEIVTKNGTYINKLIVDRN